MLDPAPVHAHPARARAGTARGSVDPARDQVRSLSGTVDPLPERAHGSAVTKLSGHASEQVSENGAIRTSSVSKLEARKALQLKLELIDQTARALKIDQFFMPRNRSDAALIATGEAFAREAEALKEDFIKQGLAAEFIENLKAAVRNLQRTTLDESAGKGKRRSAIAGFDDTLKQALDDLQRFDALVANALGDKPEVIAAWRTARRVGRPPVKHIPPPAPTPSPVPAQA